MTKTQIKAELRREAKRKFPMFINLSRETCYEAEKFLPPIGKHPWCKSGDRKRTFMLLLAEAM